MGSEYNVALVLTLLVVGTLVVAAIRNKGIHFLEGAPRVLERNEERYNDALLTDDDIDPQMETRRGGKHRKQ